VLTCPAFFGGDNWWSYSFDPNTGYTFVPTMKTCMTIAGKSAGGFKAGLGYLDETFQVRPVAGSSGWGALQAIDLASGKKVWSYDTKMPWNDGTLTTDSGLVFSGTPDQKFFAFDAKDGKILWTHHISSGVIGQPMSYQVDGKQYVAVVAGCGGVSPLWGGPKMAPMFKSIPLGGRLYVFTLSQ
jgi:alcohol dehydrogenase (cytochrome c)